LVKGDTTLVIGPLPQHKTLLIDMGEELSGKKTHYADIATKLKVMKINHHGSLYSGQQANGQYGVL